MVIIFDRVKNTWDVYELSQFRKWFKIKGPLKHNEDLYLYIIRHLEKDKRKFEVEFFHKIHPDGYEDFIRIKQVK